MAGNGKKKDTPLTAETMAAVMGPLIADLQVSFRHDIGALRGDVAGLERRMSAVHDEMGAMRAEMGTMHRDLNTRMDRIIENTGEHYRRLETRVQTSKND